MTDGSEVAMTKLLNSRHALIGRSGFVQHTDSDRLGAI